MFDIHDTDEFSFGTDEIGERATGAVSHTMITTIYVGGKVYHLDSFDAAHLAAAIYKNTDDDGRTILRGEIAAIDDLDAFATETAPEAMREYRNGDPAGLLTAADGTLEEPLPVGAELEAE